MAIPKEVVDRTKERANDCLKRNDPQGAYTIATTAYAPYVTSDTEKVKLLIMGVDILYEIARKNFEDRDTAKTMEAINYIAKIMYPSTEIEENIRGGLFGIFGSLGHMTVGINNHDEQRNVISREIINALNSGKTDIKSL
ncbi:MAG: hypothetical protein CVU81_00225 [Euryarchaeota archaeon HGW-Euryarchaeota-1]|nr:MAG: hypothetical protein CVU81_00225 [Euryarchaeota archaeon HGW-Euryarchaeota-1]